MNMNTMTLRYWTLSTTCEQADCDWLGPIHTCQQLDGDTTETCPPPAHTLMVTGWSLPMTRQHVDSNMLEPVYDNMLTLTGWDLSTTCQQATG